MVIAQLFDQLRHGFFGNLVAELPEGKRGDAPDLPFLVLKRPLTRIYWLNVADRTIPFVGVIEQTNLIGPEHYGGKHIVYLANYLGTDHRLYQMGHEELLQEYVPHLCKINPEFEPS